MEEERVFILEDRPERLPLFYELLAGHDIEVASSVDEAIDIFTRQDFSFDTLFLDHDLGGESFVDSSEYNTGTTFAQWLLENDENVDERNIIIHSMNPSGAYEMKEMLPFAQIVPYSVLKDHL